MLAHRGASSVAPENTIAAAQAALEAGADGWELDVRMTGDGELVLMHEGSLEHTTDAATIFPQRAPWRVEDFTLEELRRVDAGSWFIHSDPFGTIASGELPGSRAETMAGEPIPTLREALLWSRERGMRVDMELKGDPLCRGLSEAGRLLTERAVSAVRELGMTDRVVVTSFDHEMLRHVKHLVSELAVGALMMSMVPCGQAYLRQVGADGLVIPLGAYDAEKASALRNAGYFLFLWEVEGPDAPPVGDDSVDGVITDWPQRW